MKKIQQTIINNLAMRYKPLMDEVDTIEVTASVVVNLYKDEPLFSQYLARNMVKTSLQMMDRAVATGLYRKVAS